MTCLEQWVVNVVKKKKEEIEQKAERPGPGPHVWSLLLHVFRFCLMSKREVRVINRRERHGYIVRVTEDNQSDKRSKLKGKGLSTM